MNIFLFMILKLLFIQHRFIPIQNRVERLFLLLCLLATFLGTSNRVQYIKLIELEIAQRSEINMIGIKKLVSQLAEMQML